MIFLLKASQNPEDFNLPTVFLNILIQITIKYIFYYISDYLTLGNLSYKIYHSYLNYGDAKAQCESDGSFLAIPRSQAENDFIASLNP